MSDTQELQGVIEQALNTPVDVQRTPTVKEIQAYKKNLKENTELLELEARNWKAQYESLTYRLELGKLNATLSVPQVPVEPKEQELN